MEEYSVFSKTPYDLYYEGKEFAQQQLKDYGLTEWTIDNELSDLNSAVIVNPDEKELVVSYRGTDPKNLYDLVSDIGIFTGRHRSSIEGLRDNFNDRFTKADKKYNEAIKKYPEYTPTLTGHSLGGSQALYVGRKNDISAKVFNAGASFNDIIAGLICKGTASCEANKQHTIYTTGKDLISISNLFSNEEIVKVPVEKKKDLLYHSLDYFLPEKKISSKKPRYLLPIPRDIKHKHYFYKDDYCIKNQKDPLCGRTFG